MSLVKSLGGSTAISALGTISSYALTILLARDGGSINFGTYALCLAWAAIMTTLIDCASDAAFTHLTTRKGNPQAAFDTIFTVRLSVFVILGCVLGIARLAELIDMPWQTFLLLLPAFNFGVLFEYQRSNLSFAAIICAEKFLLLFCNAILLSFFTFGDVVYVCYAAVSFASLLVQAAVYRRFLLRLKPAPAREILFYVASYWPLLTIALAQLGYGHLSRIIIQGKQGLEVFAAVSLAFQFITLASIFQSQVDRAFRPLLIAAMRQNNKESGYDLVGRYLIFATLPMAMGAALIFALAPQLIHMIYGPEYALAGQVLREISPLFVSISLVRLADLTLLSLDLIRHNLFVNVAVSFMMLLIMFSLSASSPLSLFIRVIVVAQFVQAAVGGMLAYGALRWRVS